MMNCRERITSNKLRILIICGIILLVSCPLFTKGIATGHDMDFHAMRIEGLTEELRRGIFPVRMSSSLIGGYGYPISVFYGDILLYIPAVLRMTGLSMITVLKSYILAINAGTVIVSYICFERILKSEVASYLATLAYATASYRLVCIYVRSAMGEITAMMFLPIVALAVYRFYTLDTENWDSYKHYALILAAGMTGVLTCHLASTTMVVATLFFLGLALWKKTFTRNVLGGYALAAVATIGLSAFFLVPFLDYFIRYYIAPAIARSGLDIVANGSAEGIRPAWFKGQSHGAYVTQYFAFFQNQRGWSTVDLTSRLALTPGPALMGALIVALVAWVKGKATRETKIYVIFSALMLWMASDLFPWDYLTNTPLGKVLATVQFPWRYLTIAIVFLTMLVGADYGLIERNANARKDFCVLMAGACIVMTVFSVSNYSNDSSMKLDYNAETNTYAYMDGQYLRVDPKVPLSFSGDIASEGTRTVELLKRDGSHVELYCETLDNDGTVELPILNYEGYQVMDEHGNQLGIVDGTDNVIRFTVPAGFAGRIMVDFVEPWYWRFGEGVSLATALAMCVAAINFRRGRRTTLARSETEGGSGRECGEMRAQATDRPDA